VLSKIHRDEKVLQTHPPITNAIIFFHTLFAQHVSTLNCVLFRYFFTNEKYMYLFGKKALFVTWWMKY
jgi:hypothetical protein